MHDPRRIPEILHELARLWWATPGLRLGQLVINLVKQSCTPATDPFYIADDVLLASIKRMQEVQTIKKPPCVVISRDEWHIIKPREPVSLNNPISYPCYWIGTHAVARPADQSVDMVQHTFMTVGQAKQLLECSEKSTDGRAQHDGNHAGGCSGRDHEASCRRE